MKKILKPAEGEEVIYYSDFTGKPVGSEEYGPEAAITIEFNYGSKYDSQDFRLHLSDQDVELIVDFLNTKLQKKVDLK